jgi:uncharacterized membrane protein
MDDISLARALHVLSVVLWIGGVGFVTTVTLPTIRRLKVPGERLSFFDAFERPFAWQARITTTLTGITGLYMLIRLARADLSFCRVAAPAAAGAEPRYSIGRRRL